MLLPYGLPVAPPTFGFSFHHPLHSPCHISESLVSGVSNPSVPSILLPTPLFPFLSHFLPSCRIGTGLSVCLAGAAVYLQGQRRSDLAPIHVWSVFDWAKRVQCWTTNTHNVCMCVYINILQPTAKIQNSYWLSSQLCIACGLFSW